MTKRLAFMLAASLGIGGLGACAGSATGTTYGGGGAGYVSVTVRSPELVTIDEDVYVLADADDPIFYADDNYWLYRDNRWYRSRSYDRDWVYVSSPSPRVRRIHEPTAYVRYRSRHQEARTRPAPAPWREEYDRTDAPSRPLPPREQQPLQPTQPQQPAQPYPRPPQQEPVRPQIDHRPPGQDIRPTTPPGQDVRPVPPGHDNRPAQPPGQDRDRAKPQPPAGGAHVTPPGPPANHDVRAPNNNPRETHPSKAPPPRADDRRNDDRNDRDDKRKQEKEDKKDKKHDH